MDRSDNNNKYFQLREEFPYFEYQSYSFRINKQKLEITFSFSLAGKYRFSPTIEILSRDFYGWDELTENELNNLVFHIGMVEMVSYWKTVCSPSIIIKPHSLSEKQAGWWKKLFYHGLGEFFYLNGITPDYDSFVSLRTEGEKLPILNSRLKAEPVVVPVGGGKDSAVTLEVLKEGGVPVRPMALNPREAVIRTLAASGFSEKEAIIVNRKLDPKLLELNEQGFLNGHTPFSALLAFVNVLTAIASGSARIALSNESSANQSTVPGTSINHQYSKSYEFEKDFRQYVNEFIHPGIEYFSFLRPLNELQIASLFSKYPAHFKGFRSCNVGSKKDAWCGKCPKCLFTNIILAPFLDHDERINIFGGELLDDPELEPVFNELTGLTAIKPFECVGTPDEVGAALLETANTVPEAEHPFLLRKYLQSEYKTPGRRKFGELLFEFNRQHFLPDKLESVLTDQVESKGEGFYEFLKKEFEGIGSILILGFGREGRSTAKLIIQEFPGIKLGIADRDQNTSQTDEAKSLKDKITLHTGEKYLDSLSAYDLVFVSPGIKLNRDTLPQKPVYVSQTSLFLKYYRQQTIGVTGTKGKSTTASLICHLLRSGGWDALLVGNIGKPAFDHIKEINPKTLVVFELSAHQLKGVDDSPAVAVWLNVFPEHLDHFDSYDAYFRAKQNITRFQSKNDSLICGKVNTDPDRNLPRTTIISDELIDKMLEGVEKNRLPLKGKHNLANMAAALVAVQTVGMDNSRAKEALKNFTPLPHRLEYIGTYAGMIFYNDSISTVPQSTIAAVNTIGNVNTLILGGYDRGLDYKPLVEFLQNSRVSNFLLLGMAGEKLYGLFTSDPMPGQTYLKKNDLAEIFTWIMEYAEKGSVILLSPAAASYDQFHNFEHRGDVFRKLAESLK